jgi:hypothetical protein
MSGISLQQKKDPQKKKERKKKRKREKGREKKEQGLKSKRGETSYEEALCFKRRKEKKRKDDEIYKLLGEILSNERRSHFPIVQNPMCGPIHTHTSFPFALPSIPWLFPFLPPFTTPFSINHDYLPHKLSRFFLCFYNM